MRHLDESSVLAFIGGGLPAADREGVEDHLDRCGECRQLVTAALHGSLESHAARRAPFLDTTALDVARAPTVPPGRAYAQPAGASLPIGEVLGRYTIRGILGEGAMGIVYAAHDSLLDRRVALKVVASDFLASAAADLARARLLREAQTAARLSHPNVVTVYDAGTFGSEIFIAMELVEGESLSAWLKGPPRAAEAILDLFVQAGQGLVAAHEAGLVHRDFKPANVIVGNDGRARVADFGLAGWLDAPDAGPLDQTLPSLPPAPGAKGGLALTHAGAVMGTPRYMAPEQHRGERAGPAADQFSFAVSLYEALYGGLPHDGDTMEALAAAKSRGPKAAQAQRGLPKAVRAALSRALSPAPERRFSSMSELVGAISTPRVRRTRTWLVALAVASVVLAGVGYGATVGVAKRQALCSGSQARVSTAWDAGRRTRMAEAFHRASAGHAAETWIRVERELDRYAASWVSSHHDVCTATRVRAEQSEAVMDLRMACLEEKRRELDALTATLSEADEAVVDRSLAAVVALSPITTCDDVRTLLSRPREPVGPEVEAVRTALASSRALAAVGRYEPAAERATEALDAARSLGHAPLESEALLVLGFAQGKLGKFTEAAESCERAADRAQAAGDDRQVAASQVELVFAVGYGLGRVEEGQSWARRASATLARIGGDADIETTLESSIAAMYSSLGRFDEAETHSRVALDKLALVQRPKEYLGMDRAMMLRNLAFDLMEQGKVEEARTEASRALELATAALGPLHPEVAEATSVLAGADIRAGDAAAALLNYQKSTALLESQLGRGNIRVGIELMNLSEPLKRLGRHDEALSALERAGRIFEAAANRRLVAGVQERQGEVYAETKDWLHAEAQFRRALVTLGVDGNPGRVAEASIALGALLRERGDTKGALAMFDQAVVALERGKSADVPTHVRALSERGRARLALGQQAAGLSDLERAVELGLTAEDALETALARLALAEALARGGDVRARSLAAAARPALLRSKDDARLAIADRLARGR